MKTECESRELRRHEGSAVVKVVESESVAVGERGRVAGGRVAMALTKRL